MMPYTPLLKRNPIFQKSVLVQVCPLPVLCSLNLFWCCDQKDKLYYSRKINPMICPRVTAKIQEETCKHQITIILGEQTRLNGRLLRFVLSWKISLEYIVKDKLCHQQDDKITKRLVVRQLLLKRSGAVGAGRLTRKFLNIF